MPSTLIFHEPSWTHPCDFLSRRRGRDSERQAMQQLLESVRNPSVTLTSHLGADPLPPQDRSLTMHTFSSTERDELSPYIRRSQLATALGSKRTHEPTLKQGSR